MRSARLSILAGTAVALIMVATGSVSAAPRNDVFAQMPSPGDLPPVRNVRPGSTQKPSTQVDERIMHGRHVGVPPQSAQMRRPQFRDAARPVQTASPAQPARVTPVHQTPASLAPQTAPAGTYNLSEPARAAAAPQDMTPPVAPRAAAPATAAVEPPASAPQAHASAAPATPGISDSVVSDKLRELFANKQLIERSFPRKNERDAVIAIYQKERNFAPIWIANGSESERAQAAAAYLKTVDADGLDPNDYPLPAFSASSPDRLAEAELKFTATMLIYARHAQTGRVAFSRVSPNIEYKEKFDPAEALKQMAAASDMRRTLDGFEPQQHGYKALKAKYAELRNAAGEADVPRIAHGQTLKYARDRRGREFVMTDPRLPEIRERMGLAAGSDPTRYDRATAEAVAKYQKLNGMKADGMIGNALIDSLNPPSREQKLGAMQATLERWRWMPRDLGRAHVMLNIPEYYLHVMNNGAQVWQTKVVVGKPGHETPLLSETMKFITVNPTWNVPQSIIYNELLPVYESSDPHIFDRMGLKLERNADGSVRVYQLPGEANALGRIRFNFPNKFLVYQHDTPEKYYFAYDMRAQSHGCMRVQDPMKYAEVMLSLGSPKGGYTQERIGRMIGRDEQQLDMQTPIPVHITYQTAFVDNAGKLQFRNDIYGLDAKLLSILKTERAVADVAVERPADPNFKPTPESVHRMQAAAGGGSPFSLFEQLFR